MSGAGSVLSIPSGNEMQAPLELRIHPTFIDIEGMDKFLWRELKGEFGFFVKGAIHSKAYESGRWDGFIHVIQEGEYGYTSAVLSTGFLERLKRLLDRLGEPYEIVRDFRPQYEWQELCPQHPELTMRYFQEDALEQIFRYRRGIIVAPPRAGKTVIAVETARRTSLLPFIYMVWGVDVADQACKSFKKFLPTARVGIIADGVADIEDKDIIVATVQSLAWAFGLNFRDGERPKSMRRKEKRVSADRYDDIREIIRSAKAAVWDEAHHVGGDVARHLAQEFENAELVLGLTGTPWREDEKSILLEEVCGPIIYKLGYEEAVQAGCILPVTVTVYKFRGAETLGGVYQQAYEDAVSGDEKFHKMVAGLVDQYRAQGLTVAVIVNRESHGRVLSVNHLSRVMFVWGRSPKEERERAWNAIAKRDGTCIVSTLIDEALDLPELDVVIIADVRKSGIKAMQRLRSMTATERKRRAFAVFFIPEDVPYIEKHAKRALQFIRSEQPPFRVFARRVYADGTIDKPRRLPATQRPSRTRSLTILPGATREERESRKQAG